jgi:hypothetical protein
MRGPAREDTLCFVETATGKRQFDDTHSAGYAAQPVESEFLSPANR